MNLDSILFVIGALLVSLAISFYQYFYRSKDRSSRVFVLFGLRALAIFLILLLFVNPVIKHTEIITEKPSLVVLLDDSESIDYFKERATMNDVVNRINGNTALSDKFDISFFTFGNGLAILDSLNFAQPQTNIEDAIDNANKAYTGTIAPIVMISDGNQTIGNDYEYSTSKNHIYPVIVGDTLTYQDLKIEQLNVNKYSYLNNRFPVEALLFYDGDTPVSSRFVIRKNGKRVFSKKFSFSSEQRSQIVSTSLPSLQKGKNYYTASIEPIQGEKNELNNVRTFSVDVIDEQTKILIVTSILHPDIGAIKKSIETNKQRKVDVKVLGKDDFNRKEYQLIIAYQPNASFGSLFESIKDNKENYLIITGTQTDWAFVNDLELGVSKNAIQTPENYLAEYNQNFLTFSQNDIGFGQFPPLQDKFGEITISKSFETLLNQNINGVSLEFPLFATLEANGQRSAFLLGEGVWKWRAASFLSTNSFQDFDNFIGSIIQYLASRKIRKRLDVSIDDIFPANTTIRATAFYVDKNYKFDDRASITMKISNEDRSVQKELPFSVVGNAYLLDIEDLPPGDYSYVVSVAGQTVSSSGNFKVTTFNVEEQFTRANTRKLKRLAQKTGGVVYHKSELDQLFKALIENKDYVTTQRSEVKNRNIIDWEWLLVLAIVLLATEWFMRKYYGKI